MIWAIGGVAALIVALGVLLIIHLGNIREDTLVIRITLSGVELDMIRRMNRLEDQLKNAGIFPPL